MIVANPEQIPKLKYKKSKQTWPYRKKTEKLEDGGEQSIRLVT
jgi:hypothetical protein